MNKVEELTEILHNEKCSLVIGCADGSIYRYYGRGVKDLYDALTGGSGVLRGSTIADKVIGKGAAALMAAGGVVKIYGDVVSHAAMKLLEREGIETLYGTLTDSIINRAGTGPCPVEELTRGCETSAECIPLIAAFIGSKTKG